MPQRDLLNDVSSFDWYIGPPFRRSSCRVSFKPGRVKLVDAIIFELLVVYFLRFVICVHSCRVEFGSFRRKSTDIDGLIKRQFVELIQPIFFPY